MVIFVGIRSPPWSLPAPPRRRIALCPSLVSLGFFFFFFQLPQGRQCLFEIRSVPDWHGIGTNLVRTNPPTTFVIVNFLWSQMVGMIFVRKIMHLATKIFGSTNFNHIPAEFIISYKSIVDTLEVFLFVLLLELMGDVVFLVSLLLPVTVPVRSPFLYVAVRNRKEVHRVLDEFSYCPLFLFARSARTCTRTCSRRCRCPSVINILCTAFWVPCRVSRTVRCSQRHESFVLILDWRD